MTTNELCGKRLDSENAAGLIDRLCDEFEATWKSGGRPLIEDYLTQRGVRRRLLGA